MAKHQTSNSKHQKNIKHQTSNLMLGICVLFVSCFLYLVSFQQAFAQSTVLVSERILKSTLSQGHTISSPENDLKIQIKPNTLNRSAFVELIKPEFYPKTPLDKTLISNIYYYSILPTTNNQLPASVTLKFSYPNNEERYREIYIHNQELNTWQHLPGYISVSKHELTANTKWASGFIAVFADHLDRTEYLKKKINSPSILVANTKTREILVERGSDIKRPIASLTKLMTASVFLDHNPGWDKKIAMKAQDDTIPAKIYVKPGDVLTTRDLFYSTLLRSANNAAKALARSTGLTHAQFVDKMNEKAKKLGMNNTQFVEVTGLSEKNVSTAQDYLKLTKRVFSDLLFLQATTPKYVTIATVNNGKKHLLKNTNKLLDVPYVVIGSKTGYTVEAGRCLVMKARNKENSEIISIILGADKSGAHWDDMRLLLDAALSK